MPLPKKQQQAGIMSEAIIIGAGVAGLACATVPTPGEGAVEDSMHPLANTILIHII